MARVLAESVLELIGQTPLLHLNRIQAKENCANIYAKLEYLNPGGSIKDRAAMGLILDAERRGVITTGSTIIEPTAGNTGIGLALIGRARGYRVILCVPEGYSREKMIVTEALGGEIIYTPQEEGMTGAINKARELAAQIPNSFIPQQFENPANPRYHYMTTAVEIDEALAGKVDAVVIGCGSCGTFTGVARYFKERNPKVLAVAVETEGSVLGGGKAGPHKVEGIGTSFIPGNFDREVCDEIIAVTDEDAFRMVKRLAREEGVLCGGSAGANAFAALQVARRFPRNSNIVTVFADGAERYLSKGIFDWS
ncbi:MAG: cysteine synthase A [Acidobacteriota bacterium]|nr:cysteine synthase A [Blastocatellia bacterium]MDW8413561.1 cysteine synthase A [Acidobacteriota bacterium]